MRSAVPFRVDLKLLRKVCDTRVTVCGSDQHDHRPSKTTLEIQYDCRPPTKT